MIINYDKKLYNFGNLIQQWFEWDEDLCYIHKQHNYEKKVTRETDQNTIWHKIYYKKIKEDINFLYTYYAFLKKYIKPLYKNKIIFQAIPCLRTHLPNSIAIGEYHKDKKYREETWVEGVKELNYYLPLTNTNQYNTLWKESEEDKGDFSPVLINPGQCLRWDGCNLTHGNKKNTSKFTRISIDFRIIDSANFKNSNFTSINTKTPFKLGGYYNIL